MLKNTQFLLNSIPIELIKLTLMGRSGNYDRSLTRVTTYFKIRIRCTVYKNEI